MQKIKLSGAKNARDFGGTVTGDGRTVRQNCFIRSNALCSLTEKDIEILTHEYRLGTVIDLRTTAEINEKPDVKIPGVEYVGIPLISESAAGISHEEETDKKAMLNSLPDMRALYRSIVTDEYSVSQLKKVFSVITQSDGARSVLWHCTEGKDRCGIVSALFLSMLGADRETVYTDYLMTNKSSSKNVKKYCTLVFFTSLSADKANKIRRIFKAERDYLDAAFDVIDSTYSGTDNFLRDRLGITDSTREEMKQRFLL